ncbi:MAG: asparagine synthase (glutamine-hydrolyzing) [Acidobacteria bacterium 13_1_40CM_65_14]|nr:MAG: asparagine synthase (glutamine-hydrolyzing) [Acidobacteria bacterium 13_1_40CM_65_14]OLC76326.1 MAG: asparagine synthase (glutamine-hydrolyzing) [Acidobacteria bacterium 13_1_40CM_4_65_8]OLE85047.1 MAG: asparagine synthase (glutamine-hydrolyzing) [Acidobacteria bacterium 13_1_20CM_2_65_9]
MCGIAGILLKDPSADTTREQPRLAAAMERLRHRGPDDLGFYQRPAVLLGHRRLSILDLSPAGHQPMTSRDGESVLVLNGEIYNYLELRRELAGHGHCFRTGTDTEVLLAAFTEWGTGCLEKFRGMFAFALWNNVTRRLLVARDRVGEKPLYYWRDGRRFVFASEIKALLELIPGRPALSPEQLNVYLHYQFVIEPETLLEGIHKLPAGHFLEISVDHWYGDPRQYWDISSIPPIGGEPAATLREVLESAVEMTLRSDAPVGIALSGGMDSGVIAALASRKRADLTAFTIGYPGQYDFDERQDARRLAELLGIPWHSAELATDEFAAFFPQLVASVDEPIADVAAYGHHAVSKLAASHGIKVLLTGIGGDELFFGYDWVREALRLSRIKIHAGQTDSAWSRARASLMRRVIDHPGLLNIAANRRLPEWWRVRVDRFFDYGKIDLEHPDDWVFYQLDYHWKPACRFSEQIFSDDVNRQLPPGSAYRLMHGLTGHMSDPQIGICKLLFDSWLVSNCLALGDRVSMASSVEARIPLLDATLIETVVGFWRAGRTDDSQGHKLWLRAVAKDLLPPQVLNRPKRGFLTPTAQWMAAVNARYRSHLLGGALVDTNILDGTRLRHWMERTPVGLQRDFFQYKLTLLELWSRLVIHGQKPHEIVEAKSARHAVRTHVPQPA